MIFLKIQNYSLKLLHSDETCLWPHFARTPLQAPHDVTKEKKSDIVGVMAAVFGLAGC